MAELFLDYFKTRWAMEKAKLGNATENKFIEDSDFLYAPASARKKCSDLFPVLASRVDTS
jgi:hypothetical protein